MQMATASSTVEASVEASVECVVETVEEVHTGVDGNEAFAEFCAYTLAY